MRTGPGIRCMMMRGGTSKGLYFLATDLPPQPEQRDALLLRIMGSGHPLQIDGLGGAHSLTSKVAVVSPSGRGDADIDYLFLQLGVDQATITDRQNCGNILAGVGPFAVERGLIEPGGDVTTTRMPVVVARAADLGITGYESHAELAGDAALRDRVQALRLAAGQLMGLGDVSQASVPKTTLVSAPRDGGTICTRTFIPVRPHTAIGVLGAVSAVTALLLPGAAGAELADRPGPGQPLDVEHPTGHLLVEAELDTSQRPPLVRTAGVVRTARKLFDGTVFASGQP